MQPQLVSFQRGFSYSRLARSPFRGISALRKIITFAGCKLRRGRCEGKTKEKEMEFGIDDYAKDGVLITNP